MHGLRVVGLLLGAAIALSSTSFADPPAALAAGDQFQMDNDATYELLPDRGVVRVTQVITIANRKASKSRSYTCSADAFDPYVGWYSYETTCTTRTNFYYVSTSFYIESDAKNVRIKANRGSAKLTKKKLSGDWRLWRVDFSNLFYGDSRKLTVTYDLPGGGPRSTLDRRVGWGGADFCVAGGSGDSGRVRVEVPAGFELETSVPMTSRVAGQRRTFDSGRLKEKPWKFLACLAGSDPTAFESTDYPLADGRTVTVEAVRGDDEWATAVAAAVDDFEAMVDEVGPGVLPSTLTVREAYVQAYDEADARLTLYDTTMDRAALVDRLATAAWLPADTFPGGWLRGGYLLWLQHEAGTLDLPCEDPRQPGTEVDLDRWVGPRASARVDDQEAWISVQQGACFVMRSLAEAMGRDRMLAALGLMRDGADAWDPTQPRETASRSRSLSWEYWLDMVTEQGLIPAGADAHLAADLLLEFGVVAEGPEADALAAQTAARDAYHAYEASGQPMPPFIPALMRERDGEAVTVALSRATAALDAARSAAGRVTGVDGEAGPVAAAVGDAEDVDALAAAEELATLQLDVADEVATAFEAEAAPRDALQELGLMGSAAPDHAPAIAAVDRVDASTARAEAAGIRAWVDGARDAGTQRAALIAGMVIGLLAVVVVGALLVRRRRRRAAPTSA